MTHAAVETASSPPAHAHPADHLFDWRLDAERFMRHAAEARQSGRPDPWTLAEAECSLDLIDAELKALERRAEPSAAEARGRLKLWRTQIALAIRTLTQV